MFERIRLFPVLIAVLAGFLGLKGLDLWLGIDLDVSGIDQAMASDSQPVAASPKVDVDPVEPEPGSHETDGEIESIPDSNEYLSAADVDILNSMEERNAKYEAWEEDLKVRETMLAVTEKKVEGKIAELRELEATLKQLVGEQSAKEEADLLRLVKVYENMKAKAAAPILERLDSETQLSIASRMREVKLAAILPYMSKPAAEQLTTQLMHRSEMPDAFRAAELEPEL